MPGAQPQESRMTALLPTKNNDLNMMTNNELARGTFHRSTSPLATPVIFTWKKDSNLQPCFDYQQLQEMTVRDK